MESTNPRRQILDTGCRIEELLSARVSSLDLDNLLSTVIGKGDKQRIVPFSFELRKRLVRFAQIRGKRGVVSDWIFAARSGGRWHQRNALRSYYLLLGRVGVPKSGFHRLRHSFATHYLRHGGDVVRLSKILGHSEVGTTMKYLHLVTASKRHISGCPFSIGLRESFLVHIANGPQGGKANPLK